MRICIKIIFHLSKLWKAKFSLLCDVIFLVRLQGNFDIDHSHLGVQGLNHSYPFAAEHVGPSSWPFADWVLPSVMGWHSLTCHHLLGKHLKTQPHLVILIWWIDFLALHHTNAVSGSEYCRYDGHFFSLTFEQALNPTHFLHHGSKLGILWEQLLDFPCRGPSSTCYARCAAGLARKQLHSIGIVQFWKSNGIYRSNTKWEAGLWIGNEETFTGEGGGNFPLPCLVLAAK